MLNMDNVSNATVYFFNTPKYLFSTHTFSVGSGALKQTVPNLLQSHGPNLLDLIIWVSQIDMPYSF